jgi:hypothetical protein
MNEPEVQQLFTPEVLAELDQISAEIKAGGKSYTMEEVREHLEKTRKEAVRKMPGGGPSNP